MTAPPDGWRPCIEAINESANSIRCTVYSGLPQEGSIGFRREGVVVENYCMVLFGPEAQRPAHCSWRIIADPDVAVPDLCRIRRLCGCWFDAKNVSFLRYCNPLQSCRGIDATIDERILSFERGEGILSNRYLPDWLYRTLPFVYVAAGVVTMTVLSGEIAILSGLTLLSAGVIVWLMRRRPEAESHLAAHQANSKGLVEISWNKAFECGHDVLDTQHRRLFGLSNELIDALLTKKPKYDIEFLLNDLVDHIGNHFSTEEAILAENGYGVTREHQELHRTLLARAIALRDGYRNGNVLIQELIGFVTYDVVTAHIVEESRNFGALKDGAVKGDTLQPAERERRESMDTVLKMNREDPASAEKTHLTIPILDRLTPEKRLFNSYPHVWQRICMFAPEPRHLEKYLSSLAVQDRGEKRVGFSEGALKELADIYAENQKFLPKAATVWQTDVLNP